jgi:general secretion pathway protein N
MLIVAVVGVHDSTNGIAGADVASPAQARLGSDASSEVEIPVFVGNPVTQVPLDRLSATRDRPLFSPSRQPTFPKPPAPAMPRIALAPPPQPVQSPSVALFGIIVDAQGARALIGTGAADPIVGVRRGDDVNGWKVTAITKQSLVLSRADLSATFMLFSPENANRTAGSLSAAPIQQVQRTPDGGRHRSRIR